MKNRLLDALGWLGMGRGARLPLVLMLFSMTGAGCASKGPLPAVEVGGPPIRRTLVGRAPAHETGWETRLYIVTYAPGAEAPLHIHPARGVGWVIEGELESAFGDEPVVRAQTGGAFTDEAEVVHRIFRNPSRDRPLRFAIAYTLRIEDENFRLVPAPR